MELTNTVDFESADDIALADKMKVGRQQIINELGKRIIGQSDVIELILLSLFAGSFNLSAAVMEGAWCAVSLAGLVRVGLRGLRK